MPLLSSLSIGAGSEGEVGGEKGPANRTEH